MSMLIYYFSGTGNSFAVAGELATKTGNEKIIPIANAVEANISGETDSIGIVFPILMFGVAPFVKNFIKKLVAATENKYVFFVATNGGLIAGSFLQIQKITKGNRTNQYSYYSFVIKRKDFSKTDWEASVQNVVQSISKKESRAIDHISFRDRIILTGMINPLGNTMMKASFAATDACTGCGTCYRICPTGSIGMKNGKPEWAKTCSLCYGCINWCPVHAITAKKASSFTYRSPLISSAEELYIRDIPKNQ